MTARQGTARRGLGATTRLDAWWIGPALTGLGFAALIGYALWSVFIWSAPPEAGPYRSPFFSPRLAVDWWPLNPALLTVWAPIGFRATCYYFRRAYYRAFLADPPACAVGEPGFHLRYSGETRLPFILQNLHRFFLYPAIVALVFQWIEALLTLGHEGRWGFGLGSAILLLDAAFVGLYVISCHSFRHLVGGRLDCFSCSAVNRARHGIWLRLSRLNARHMAFAWISWGLVSLADLYVRLVALGVIADPRLVL